VADNWVSPTGHNDLDAYVQETQAYDGNVATDGCYTATNGGELELTIGAIVCDKVRIHAADWDVADLHSDPTVTISVYYGGAYHQIYTGSITKDAWIEVIVGSTEVVTKAKISFTLASLHYGHINEFAFNSIPPEMDTDACTDVDGSSFTANGEVLTAVASSVTTRGFHYSKVFDNFEWGSDEDPLSDDGGAIDWTTVASGDNKAEIDTSQHYTGTRSAHFHYVDGEAYGYFSQTAVSATQVLFTRFRKDDSSKFFIFHGNGSYRIWVRVDVDEDIEYNDGSYHDTGADVEVGTWYTLAIQNVDWDNHTYDIYLNGLLIQSSASMASSSGDDSIVRLSAQLGEAWADEVAVWDIEDEDGTFSEGTYDLPITSLDANTQYYVQAFGKNSVGYGYGDVVSQIVPVGAECAVGLATTSSRTGGLSRAASNAVGLVTSALKQPAKIVSLAVGLVTSASRTLGATRAASKAIGLVTSASRTSGIQRLASKIIGLVTSASFEVSGAAGVNVERGVISLTNSTLSSETTLTAPVDVGRAFVIASVRSDQDFPVYSLAKVELTDEVSGQWTKVKATRNTGGTGYDCYVEWQVISGSGLTVQTGEKVFTNDNTSETVPITSIDTTKAFIVLSNTATSANASRSFIRAKINSATEIQFDRGDSGATPAIRWWVVEWNGATVESGTSSLTGTTVTPTITEVTLAESVLFYNYYTDTTYYPSRGMVRGRFTSTTEAEFARGSSDDSCEVSYFVVSHSNFATQSAGTNEITGTSGTYTLTTPVNESAAFMATPIMGNAYTDSAATGFAKGYNTHKLFEDGTDSKVTIERGDVTGSLFPSYFVTEVSVGPTANEVIAAVAIGLVTTASRTLAATRTAASAVGLALTVSKGFIKQASSAIGLVVSASKTLAATRAASVASGLITFASHIYEGGGEFFSVTASTVVGLVTSASRTLGATREPSTLAIGLATSASQIFGKVVSAAVAVGLAITASRGAATFTRTASSIVGLAVTASRTLGVTRAASAVIGLVTSVVVGAGDVFKVIVAAGRVHSVILAEGFVHKVKTAAGRIHKVIVNEGGNE